MRVRAVGTLLLAAGLGGCAMRSDVVKLRLQIEAQQQAAARRDSATQANLGAIARLVQGVQDSLSAQQVALTSMRGDLRVDLYNVQQQLVAVQELTGQSQQRLTELRSSLDQRFEQQQAAAPPPSSPPAESGAAAPVAGAGGQGAAAGGGGESAPAPDQLMELGLQQLRRGSPATARSAFAEFLRRYPTHPRAGDAVFFTGEAWSADQRTDSAAASYREVVQHYPASGHVAAALFKLGAIANAAGRRDDARRYFNQLVGAYPLSDEAALAREQLRALGAAPKPSRP